MSLPRYPEYKDSGVVWLGEVPRHWEVKRLKHNLKLLTCRIARIADPAVASNLNPHLSLSLNTSCCR